MRRAYIAVRGDVWKSKILQRVVLGKRHGVVVVETSGGGRQTAVEYMELHRFSRWAMGAEMLRGVK
jgi:hypothetical protein